MITQILFAQMLINSESADYSDNKGKTVMHQAAEQVSFVGYEYKCESCSQLVHTHIHIIIMAAKQKTVKMNI